MNDWPENESAEVQSLFRTLDDTVQRLCTLYNAHAPMTKNVDGILGGYVVLVDERFYAKHGYANSGEFVGGNVSAVTKLEQPSYISEAIIREAAKGWGIVQSDQMPPEFMLADDFEDDDDD